MADAAIFVTAGEHALGLEDGAFMRALHGNQREINEVSLEASLITPYIKALARESFEGTASELLSEIDRTCEDDSIQRRKGWPKAPNQLSGELRRLAPNLRRIGIKVSTHQSDGSDSRKIITIRTAPQTIDATDATDADTRPQQADASMSVDGVDTQRTSLNLNGDTKPVLPNLPSSDPAPRPGEDGFPVLIGQQFVDGRIDSVELKTLSAQHDALRRIPGESDLGV